MRKLLPFVAVAMVGCVLAPVLEVGFLADDFYAVREVHEVATDVGPAQQFAATFTRRWSAELHVFRPLTLGTIFLDRWLHGADGPRYHRLNLLIFLLLIVVVADVALHWVGSSDPALRALVILLAGTHAGGLEALAWMVGRGELLVALLAFLAIRSQLLHPFSSWRRGVWVGLALLAKETAIVLPFVLLSLDRTGDPLRARFRRFLVPALLVPLYLGGRILCFGPLGGDYGGRSYTSYLFDPESPRVIARSLWQGLHKILAPVNLEQLAHRARLGGPLSAIASSAESARRGLESLDLGPVSLAAVVAVPYAVAWIALTMAGARRVRKNSLATLLVAALLPLLLMLPIPQLRVGSNMAVSRILLIPSLLAVVALVDLLVAARSSRWLVLPVGLLLLLGVGTTRLNLGAYRDASDQVNRLRTGFAAVPDGSRALLVGYDLEDGSWLPELESIRGAFVLASGLYDAARPPFRSPLGVQLDLRPRTDLDRWPPPAPSDSVLRVTRTAADPPLALETVASPGDPTLPFALELPEGQRELALGAPVLVVRHLGPQGLHAWPVRVVLVSPFGGRAEANGVVRSGESTRLTAAEFDPPINPELLALVPGRLLLGWIEPSIEIPQRTPWRRIRIAER